MEDLYVHIWFEFDGSTLPMGIPPLIYEEEILEENCEMDESEVNFGIDQEEFLYRRVRGEFKNDCYVFSFFTGGWQNIPFRAYLEIDEDKNINMITLSQFSSFIILKDSLYVDDSESEVIEKDYQINLIVPGSICIIGDTVFLPKTEKSDFYIRFTLYPKK